MHVTRDAEHHCRDRQTPRAWRLRTTGVDEVGEGRKDSRRRVGEEKRPDEVEGRIGGKEERR
jgi:hypothetical protein